MSANEKLTEPPETDLDYYARPENYTGSNLNTLTRFLVAKEKEEGKTKKISTKKTKHASEEERQLYRRYRHILPRDLVESSSASSSSSTPVSTDDETEDPLFRQRKKTKKPSHKLHRHKASSVDNCEKNNQDSKTRSVNTLTGDSQQLSSILSDDLEEDDGSGRESGYESRMRSQEGKFGDTQENQLEKDERLGHSPDLSESPRDLMPNTQTGLSGLTKLLAVNGKLLSLTAKARHRLNFQKFQRLAVAVVNILKLAKAIIKPTDSPSALLKTFTAMSAQKVQEQHNDHADKMKSYGLEFDASYFRANREISVSNEVKNILRQLPSRRTPEQVQTAIFGLQSLQSFAEYPLHMQEKLAKVAWFEIVTPMRTIIRQGHFAENFYFILSGQALVTIQKPGEPTPFTAGMMRKGTSFGELALLHHSRRTATVTSHDTVQLLSVGREDFFDIFMSGHGSDEMPEHIKFISQLDFMQDWPLERLLERPDQCLLHFFKRNMVILKDSELSEWFYVVKSGTCQVLKQLKGVTGRLGQLVSPRSSLQDTDTRFKTGAGFQASRINTGRRPLRKKLTPVSHIDEIWNHNKAENQNNRHQSGPEDKENDDMSPAERDGFLDSNSIRSSVSDDPRRNSKGSLAPSSSRRSSQRDKTMPKLSIGQPHFSPSLRQRDTDTKEHKKRNVGSYSNRRRQRKEQHRHQEQQQQQQQHHAEVPPVFVQIELLKPKDVFGLDMVNFNNTDFQPSNVSLVSLGAECIMLSKAFFLKHANDRVKKRFSEIVQAYPNERSLQASLQNKADWELYKKSLIAAVTAPKQTGFRGAPLAFSM